MTVSTSGTTRELASSLSNLRFEDLPREVVDRTEEYFLDWIASALAGRNARPVRILEHFASMMGPDDGPSEILVSRRRTSPLFAALVNGAASHVVEQEFATRQLADLGARVIKVERPGVGDFARGYDETVKGLSSHFVWLNRSKESLTLDLKQPEAKDILSRLLEKADAFIQNLAPGAAERLGFGADTLRGKLPRLIVCDVSGYGSSGPYRDKKAYDLLLQCETGLVSITGTPDTPSKVGVSIADIACGMYAYTGILTALYSAGKDRGRSGFRSLSL